MIDLSSVYSKNEFTQEDYKKIKQNVDELLNLDSTRIIKAYKNNPRATYDALKTLRETIMDNTDMNTIGKNLLKKFNQECTKLKNVLSLPKMFKKISRKKQDTDWLKPTKIKLEERIKKIITLKEARTINNGAYNKLFIDDKMLNTYKKLMYIKQETRIKQGDISFPIFNKSTCKYSLDDIINNIEPLPEFLIKKYEEHYMLLTKINYFKERIKKAKPLFDFLKQEGIKKIIEYKTKKALLTKLGEQKRDYILKKHLSKFLKINGYETIKNIRERIEHNLNNILENENIDNTLPDEFTTTYETTVKRHQDIKTQKELIKGKIEEKETIESIIREKKQEITTLDNYITELDRQVSNLEKRGFFDLPTLRSAETDLNNYLKEKETIESIIEEKKQEINTIKLSMMNDNLELIKLTTSINPYPQLKQEIIKHLLSDNIGLQSIIEKSIPTLEESIEQDYINKLKLNETRFRKSIEYIKEQSIDENSKRELTSYVTKKIFENLNNNLDTLIINITPKHIEKMEQKRIETNLYLQLADVCKILQKENPEIELRNSWQKIQEIIKDKDYKQAALAISGAGSTIMPYGKNRLEIEDLLTVDGSHEITIKGHAFKFKNKKALEKLVKKRYDETPTVNTSYSNKPTNLLNSIINVNNYYTMTEQTNKTITKRDYIKIKKALITGEEIVKPLDIQLMKNHEQMINNITKIGFSRTLVEEWCDIFKKQKHSKDFIELLAGYQGKDNLLLLKSSWAKWRLRQNPQPEED